MRWRREPRRQSLRNTERRMYLLIEVLFFGVLPVAFALWQLHDVRREQRRRRQQQQQQQRSDRGPSDPPDR